MVWYGMVSMHNGFPYGKYGKYGNQVCIMDHFTLNLRPKEYFQLAPNMRTAYIELCIYVMSKSVTYRLGGHIPIW